MDTTCRCMVCMISFFGKYVSSPAMPEILIPGKTNCSSGPAVVYQLICKSGRPECVREHYVGMASTINVNKSPMAVRWANHKSHHTHGRNLCMACHKGENAQDLVTLTILEACYTQEVVKEKETIWYHRLFSFCPTGFNKREEVILSLHHPLIFVSSFFLSALSISYTNMSTQCLQFCPTF